MTSDSASRAMRNSRLASWVLAVLFAFAGAAVLRAQDAPEPEALPPTAETPPVATPPDDAVEPAADAGDDAAPTGSTSESPAAAPSPGPADADDTRDEAAPAPKGPSPNRFEPTEKVRADFDVSFPVDI